MKGTTGFIPGWISLAIVAVLASLFLVFPLRLNATNTCSGLQGQNGVYNSTCNNGSPGVVGSSAFIDASAFAASQRPNICAVLNFVLNPLNGIITSAGGVIDARGLPGATGTSMTCTTSPWAGITNPPPATILLPATTAIAPIVIPATWILPSNTRLIGEGYGASGGTVIQACTNPTCPANFPTGSPMIQFGPVCPINPPACATAISVENLMLNGSSLNVIGVLNAATDELTYVDHVTLFQILGTGLSISAMDSGPYTNITFDSGSSALSTTTCASIAGLNGTRGLHGLTCIAGTTATAAIYLDAPNNSIEDVRVAGFYDGILVGSNATAKSNSLFNIFGDTIHNVVAPVNVIHISNVHTVTDLSIMGVNNSATGDTTIQDDLTSTTLADPYVAMYVLGKALMNGSTVVGYSRFTTSPNAATWAAGTAAPSQGCNAQTAGSLYSNTAPTTNTAALYVCPKGGGTWQTIP
jgi:hypothetical protein